MTSKRIFYALIGLVLIAGGLVIAGTVLGNLYLQQQSQKLVDLKRQNEVIESQQTLLNQAKKDIEKYSSLEQDAKAIVPQDKDQAKTVRELAQIAVESGVNLAQISFPSSTLGAIQPKAGTGTSSSSSGSTLTQLKPVDGIKGVYSLEITITPASPISYTKLIDLLQRLELKRRTSHVQSLTITPDKNQNLTFNLTLNAYVKP